MTILGSLPTTVLPQRYGQVSSKMYRLGLGFFCENTLLAEPFCPAISAMSHSWAAVTPVKCDQCFDISENGELENRVSVTPTPGVNSLVQGQNHEMVMIIIYRGWNLEYSFKENLKSVAISKYRAQSMLNQDWLTNSLRPSDTYMHQ